MRFSGRSSMKEEGTEENNIKRRLTLKISVISEERALTSRWAGGETKQYYIYPPESSYAARDFCVRLSMAVSTSDEEAQYTRLENVTRHLIMLEGSAHVFHKGRYDILMNPYKEIDVFDGGWESSAIGKIVDFNMMLSNGCLGEMSVMDESGNYTVGRAFDNGSKRYNTAAFFCGEGSASFALPNAGEVRLNKRDLLLLEDLESEVDIEITLKGSMLVRMDICC